MHDIEICRLPINEGWCNGKFKRFHFNMITGICESFVYTGKINYVVQYYVVQFFRCFIFCKGCEGNENNFLTENECIVICSSAYSKNSADGRTLIFIFSINAELYILSSCLKGLIESHRFGCRISEWSDWTKCSS